MFCFLTSHLSKRKKTHLKNAGNILRAPCRAAPGRSRRARRSEGAEKEMATSNVAKDGNQGTREETHNAHQSHREKKHVQVHDANRRRQKDSGTKLPLPHTHTPPSLGVACSPLPPSVHAYFRTEVLLPEQLSARGGGFRLTRKKKKEKIITGKTESDYRVQQYH